MTIVIDPAFSVYHLAQRIYNQKHLLRHRYTMTQISYEIEDAAAAAGGRLRIYSGFQLMSKFLPQMARYEKIAQQVESVYVFGIPDVEPPPIAGITYVRLSPQDQLSREWFVTTYGEQYASILATEEVSQISDPDSNRTFTGVWTFNPFIVSVVGDWISSAVDAPAITWEIDDRSHEHHLQGMIQSLDRLLQRVNERDRGSMNERLMTLRDELETAIRIELKPALAAPAQPIDAVDRA